MGIELTSIWTPAGLILGFQVSSFAWRLSEEAKVGDKGDIPWLVPADYVNMAGMLVLVLGVFLLPMVNLASVEAARVLCGLGVLLFVGHSFAMAGHYQLFNRRNKRQLEWFPKQEKWAVVATMLVAITISYCHY